MKPVSRVKEREHFGEETRLTLVEGDLDKMDVELRIMNERLQKIIWALVGMTITLATASVMLALNLVAGAT